MSNLMPISTIPNAEDYFCIVVNYLVGHGTMLIDAYRGEFLEEDHYYIQLSGVKYYEGSLRWPGANFTLGSTDETQALLISLGWEPNEPGLDRLKLLIFEHSYSRVKIVTDSFQISRNRPG